MRYAIAVLLMCMSFKLWAVDSVAQSTIVQAQKLANASLCESYKGDTSSFGKVMNQQCRARQRADFDAIQDQKTLKDCIKPGNVIDDDVRKCMKGI